MAGWTKLTVSKTVYGIADETFVLPVVQRRLVWSEEKMELLFDTLLKGDIFGGIMVIEEEKGSQPLFEFRRFSLNGDPTRSSPCPQLSQETLFVIDGQQRLQTLYIGLRGDIQGKRLFFDLFSNYNAYFEFKFAESEEKLPGPVAPDEDTDKLIPERKWCRVTDLYQRLERSRDHEMVADELVATSGDIDDAKRKTLVKNVYHFYKNIFDIDRVGVASVIVNRTLDRITNRGRIVELFRRLNDGGTKLSAYDLFASILKGFNWQMEAFLDRMVGPGSSYGKIGLSQDTLLKLIFVLQGNPSKETHNLEVEDANFAVENADQIERAVRNTVDFLEKSKLMAYFGSGTRTFIPLMFVAYHLFYRNAPEAYFRNYDSGNPDSKPLRQWIFHSMLNGAFKGRGSGWIAYKTGVAKILGIMRVHQGKAFPLQQLLQLYRERLNLFTTDYRAEALDWLDRDFLLYMLSDRERVLGPQDLDHIHPRSKLEQRQVSPGKINTIANLQLLDFSTNRGPKNDALFKDWLNDTKNVPDMQEFMKRQLIPTDSALHEIERFDDFIAERSRLMSEKLRSEFA